MKRQSSIALVRSSGAGADRHPQELDCAPESGIRRFPPVLQFLTEAGNAVEQPLRDAAASGFERGLPLDQVCAGVYHRALELGFLATIGVQEVYSTRMPSFPGETVWSVLLLIDLRRATAAA